MKEKLVAKEKKALIVRLPAEMLKTLKHLAVDSETSINAIVQEAIADRISKSTRH